MVKKNSQKTKYVHLHRIIWHDDKFQFASDLCQLTFLHILTSPMGTHLGLFYAPIESLAAEKRKDIKDYKRGFEECITNGFIKYNEKYRVIYIPNYLRYNPPTSPNVVTSYGKLFEEVPNCDLKTEFFQDLKAFTEDFTEAFREAFSEAFAKGFMYDFSKSLVKPPVTVIEDEDSNNLSLNLLPKDNTEEKTEETENKITDSLLEIREQTIQPQEVVDLWNAIAKQYQFPKVRKLTDELKDLIKKACKILPYRQDWDELFDEIPLSSTLQGKIGDGNWSLTLGWLLKKNRGEAESNYSKALNGAWRAKNINGMSRLAQNNMEAAEEALNRAGISTKIQSITRKEITNGRTVSQDRSNSSSYTSDSTWADAEYREDPDLP